MKYDLLIKNGRVMDPSCNRDQIGPVAISQNKIVPYDGISDAAYVFDASGCLVVPGLIDFHTHLFVGGCDCGLDPEQLLCTGVTAAVDAGTCGYSAYGSFHRTVIDRTDVKIKSLLNMNPGVLVAPGQYHTSYIHGAHNVPRLREIKERYRDEIIGLKLMLSISNVGTDADDAIDLLKETVDAAEELGNGTIVVVHTTNPPCSCDRIAGILRKGDVYCHMFQGIGNTILNETGHVYPEILEAQQRGVLFDAANGFSHFSHKVAEQALSEGLSPDIISTDSTTVTFHKSFRCRSMPHLMSRYMALGLSLEDVLKAVTKTPARLMGMQGKIGTLAEGAAADVTVLKLKNERFRYDDNTDTPRYGNELLVPQAVILNGNVVYMNPEFNIV